MTRARLQALAIRAGAAWLLVLLVAAPAALRAQPAQHGAPSGGDGPRHAGPPPHGPPPHHRGPGGPGGPTGGRSARFIEQHAERLGLDAAALDAIARISDTSKLRDRALREQLRAAHDQMRSLLSAAEPDRAAVLTQTETISALELAQHQNRLGAMLDIRGMLNPEQRALLVEISKQRDSKKFTGDFESRESPESASRRGGPGPLPGCRDDIEAICSDVGSGRPLLACLYERYDALSPRCLEFLEHGPPSRRH